MKRKDFFRTLGLAFGTMVALPRILESAGSEKTNNLPDDNHYPKTPDDSYRYRTLKEIEHDRVVEYYHQEKPSSPPFRVTWALQQDNTSIEILARPVDKDRDIDYYEKYFTMNSMILATSRWRNGVQLKDDALIVTTPGDLVAGNIFMIITPVSPEEVSVQPGDILFLVGSIAEDRFNI